MRWVKLLLFLFSFSVFADAPVLELLNQQEAGLLSLSSLMKQGQQETLNLKNSITQKEQEIKNWEIYFSNYKQKTANILRQKEIDLKRIESLLIASQESLKREKILSRGLSRDITSLENTSKRWNLWNKISIALLIAMSLITTVVIIILVKKK